MVALVVMGSALLVLFMAQTRSMRMAEKARLLTIATELARKKLIDCKYDLTKMGVFPKTDFAQNGNFAEEGHEDFEWECFAYRFDMPPPNPDIIAKAIKSQAGNNMNQQGGMDFSANALAPFFGLISSTLGDSIRELVLIVRWKNAEIADEMKVVTHLVDRSTLVLLTSQLPDQPVLPPGFEVPGVKK